MTCADALDLIEPIAAGDLEVDPLLRHHFESCPLCASALASARRIETTLAGREAPPAPARFTAAVLTRIRRERWRSEQQVDRLFNVAIGAAVLLLAGGAAALLNFDTVLALGATGWTLLSSASAGALKTAAPTLATYVGSAGLLVAALVMWWWAERRLSL